MKKVATQNMSTESLVGLFRQYALEQDQAMLLGEQAKVNRLFWKLETVIEELKSRDGDQRAALLSLYKDKNSQVRVKAMKATLAVAREQAMQGLAELTVNKREPASLEAGMSLWALEQGIFKPS